MRKGEQLTRTIAMRKQTLHEPLTLFILKLSGVLGAHDRPSEHFPIVLYLTNAGMSYQPATSHTRISEFVRLFRTAGGPEWKANARRNSAIHRQRLDRSSGQ